MRPGCTALSRLVITPPSMRSMRPSENISVWTPRSCLFRTAVAARHRGSRRSPSAAWRRPRRAPRRARRCVASTGGSGARGCSCSGRLVRTNACTRSSGTVVAPCVRGMRSLISAMTMRALSTAARAASTDVPSVQRPWRSGGESDTRAASSAILPVANRLGICDRKMG